MKVVYNSKQIADNRNNYNSLTEKPLINSVELVGNITLNDINVYSKEEIKKLISSVRSVKVAAVQPSPLRENTTYYIGPDTNGIYEVYLTDSSDPINYFKIGTTSFGKYYSGEGINVTDPGNVVSVLVDSESVIINSEGLMEARPVFEKMQPFKGATSTAAGTKGIVPAPLAGDQNKVLFGDGTWKDLVNMFHPVGSIYISYSSSYNPNSLFPGTSWTQLDTNRALETDASGGSTLDSGLPNVTSGLNPSFLCTNNANSPENTPVRFIQLNEYTSGFRSSDTTPCGQFGIDLSKGNSIYGKSTIVQPPAVKVCMWRRTA